VLDVNCHGLHG